MSNVTTGMSTNVTTGANRRGAAPSRFHFKVSNCKAGQRVLFSIINFSKQRSLFRDGMAPLVSSSSRPRWERIPAKNTFYYLTYEGAVDLDALSHDPHQVKAIQDQIIIIPSSSLL